MPRPDAPVLGRFHEIALATRDIRASVEFYEGLGFSQATTTDTRTHPYGVLTDGRLFIGLHQRRISSPTLTFVLPGVAGAASRFEEAGIELQMRHTGDDVFNEIGFRDPFGQCVSVIEARTYSPVTRSADALSACGYFDSLSLPVTDFDSAQRFWEPLGFVATEIEETPYLHLPLTSDHLGIAFHRPRTLDVPALVFTGADMRERIARLREMGLALSDELPRGLDANSNALLESPEGMHLLLLQADE